MAKTALRKTGCHPKGTQVYKKYPDGYLNRVEKIQYRRQAT
jgi:hypothetical protein